MSRCCIAALLLLAAPALAEEAPAAWTVDDCVRQALATNGLVTQAQGRVREWQARVDEVRSAYWPKLQAIGYAAPMFRVTGTPADTDVQRDLTSWGPYLHFQGSLVEPISTFGRVEAGTRAAQERAAIEEARLDQVRTELAAQVREMYYLYLYAKSIRPALATGRRALDEARKTADEEYEKASGKVTKVDLAKLAYGSSQLAQYEVQAEIGEGLAHAALAHLLGLADDAHLAIADESLPARPDTELPALASLLVVASEKRPEWSQIQHGKQAALSLAQAEKLANAPVAFVAGQLTADWTPMRPDAANPFVYDPYNQLVGGVAAGLSFDLDPAKAKAKAHAAEAMGEQVAGLEGFAKTGIPLDVRRAWDEARQADRMHAAAAEGSQAARKWLVFAGSAMVTGTGEARDLLEGLVAYLQGRRSELEALRLAHTARGNLLRALGLTGIEPDQPAAVAAIGR